MLVWLVLYSLSDLCTTKSHSPQTGSWLITPQASLRGVSSNAVWDPPLLRHETSFLVYTPRTDDPEAWMQWGHHVRLQLSVFLEGRSIWTEPATSLWYHYRGRHLEIDMGHLSFTLWIENKIMFIYGIGHCFAVSLDRKDIVSHVRSLVIMDPGTHPRGKGTSYVHQLVTSQTHQLVTSQVHKKIKKT